MHDARFTSGRAQHLALGAQAANTRHVVAADETQRAYTVGRDRRYETTPEVLPEHLGCASKISREGYGPLSRSTDPPVHGPPF